MSAVMGIVKGHGGAIIVNSSIGEGTSIRVLFPVPDAFEQGLVAESNTMDNRKYFAAAVPNPGRYS